MKKSIKLFIYLFSVILLAFSVSEVEAVTGKDCPNVPEKNITINYNGKNMSLSEWINDNTIAKGTTATGVFEKEATYQTASVKKISNLEYSCLNVKLIVEESKTIIGADLSDDEINATISRFKCSDLKNTDLYNRFLQPAYTVIKIAVPSLIVILGIFDFAGAITADDQDKMQKAQKKFVKRLFVGVALFFLPMLINAILNLAFFSNATCGIG